MCIRDSPTISSCIQVWILVVLLAVPYSLSIFSNSNLAVAYFSQLSGRIVLKYFATISNKLYPFFNVANNTILWTLQHFNFINSIISHLLHTCTNISYTQLQLGIKSLVEVSQHKSVSDVTDTDLVHHLVDTFFTDRHPVSYTHLDVYKRQSLKGL